MSQRPRYLSAEELAQWRAADARRQETQATKADELKAQFGEKFERTAEVLGVDDADVRALAADRMSTLLAERGSSPATMDHRDYMDIADRAVDFARDEDRRRMAGEIEADKQAPAADRSTTASVETTPATPDRDPEQTPERQAEIDPPLPVDHDPVRQTEATPERAPEADPAVPPATLSAEGIAEQRERVLERQFAEYQAARNGSDRNEARFEQLARRHEQELAAFDRQNGVAPEPEGPVAGDLHREEVGQSRAAGDEQSRAFEISPEPQPSVSQTSFELPDDIRRDAQWWGQVEPAHAAERTSADGAEKPRETAAEPPVMPATAEPAEPGSRRLRFYEDLKQEHADAVGRDYKSDAKAQGEGGKKLSFFEDRQPSQGQNLEP